MVGTGQTTASEVNLQEGRSYRRTRFFNLAARGDTSQFAFRNPSGSGVMVSLDTVAIAAEGKAYVELLRNPTITSIGTLIPGTNIRFDKSNSAQSEFGYSGTYSGGTSFGQELIAAGQKGTTPVTVPGAQFLIPPSYSIRALVTNQAGGSADYSFTLEWSEARTGLYPP